MPDNPSKTDAIAFIGFGEAASAFAQGWRGNIEARLLAFDIKSDDQNTRAQKLTDYQMAGVSGCASAVECARQAKIIVSMVTADQALAAASSVVDGLVEGTYYFDCNSCAPDTKRQAATIIDKAGGRYVDVALMAPVHPPLHQTPALVSGPWADEVLKVMAGLKMSATLAKGEIGTASSIKMIRSVMMKGLEALVVECVLSGRKAGVEDIVLDSLEKTYPGFNWKQRSSYMLERMMVHGNRRAAEMREVALSVEQLGLKNEMSRATVEWQQLVGDLEADPGPDNLQQRADTILAALEQTK